MYEQRCPCDEHPACMDCGANTCELNEYYWVHTKVWELAVPQLDQRERQLCVGCIEKRLGRQLVPNDFPYSPINHQDTHSERLTNRIGPLTYGKVLAFAARRAASLALVLGGLILVLYGIAKGLGLPIE